MFNTLKAIKGKTYESFVVLLSISAIPAGVFCNISVQKMNKTLETKTSEILKLKDQISDLETRLIEQTLKEEPKNFKGSIEKENMVDQSSSMLSNTINFMSDNSTYIKYILIAIILLYIGQIISYKWLGFSLWKYLGLPSISNYFGLDFSFLKECDGLTTSYDFISGDFALKCEFLNNQLQNILIKNLKTEVSYIPLHEYVAKTEGNTSNLILALTETATSSEVAAVSTSTAMVAAASHPVIRSAIASAVSSIFDRAVLQNIGLNKKDILGECSEGIKLEALKDQGNIHNPLNDDDFIVTRPLTGPTVVEKLMMGQPVENNVSKFFRMDY